MAIPLAEFARMDMGTYFNTKPKKPRPNIKPVATNIDIQPARPANYIELELILPSRGPWEPKLGSRKLTI